jgi:mono/diheme cytochrome c family protein
MRGFAIAATAALLGASAAQAQEWAAVDTVLQERCIMCHSGDGAPLGLHLDSHAALIKGSENGPVVLPGNPDGSPLMHRILGKAEPRMPLDGPPFLDDATIAMFGAWIKAGAQGPTAAPATTAEPAPPPDPRADGRITYDEVSRIFGQHCVKCHSDNSKMGAPPEGLRLGSYADILKGGDRVVLIPGNAQGSEIIRRVEGLASPRMPFDGPPWLTEEEIKLLRDWIAHGARGADGAAAPMPVGRHLRMRGILTAPAEVDGAAFVTNTATRRKDVPGVGGKVELRGRVAPDGGIIAERLRGR